MIDTLRKPFLVIATVLILLAVLVEIGSIFASETIPGMGISWLAILDGLVLFTIILIAAPLVITDRVHGRIQGIVTFVVSLLTLLGAIAMLFIALGLLILMVTLLLSIPFGTIVYLAEYTSFDKTTAAIMLSTIMTLKVGFTLFLIFAHQRFLENKGLMLIILTSFVASIILGFLHGWFPRPIVSITDAVGAIIIALAAAIWALFYLVGSIPAILKVLRVDKAIS